MKIKDLKKFRSMSINNQLFFALSDFAELRGGEFEIEHSINRKKNPAEEYRISYYEKIDLEKGVWNSDFRAYMSFNKNGDSIHSLGIATAPCMYSSISFYQFLKELGSTIPLTPGLGQIVYSHDKGVRVENPEKERFLADFERYKNAVGW